MVSTTKQNSTTFIRCPKDEKHPFCRLSSELFKLNGYQLAIMAQILSNCDEWNVVKYEIYKRLGFPRNKFNEAWKSLIELGYIKVKKIQSGYDYTIYEDTNSTSTTYGICDSFTSTTGGRCAGGTLTTIKNNYNNIITTGTDATCYKRWFDELNELYPISVTGDSGQTNFLKANIEECEKKYIEYLMTQKTSHEEIMGCLKRELDEKKQTGNAMYQPALLKWIKERRWETYNSSAVEPAEVRYGQEIL